MRDLTPLSLRCLAGSCPSVWELDDGRLQITGALSSNHSLEETIIIDRALLANVSQPTLDVKMLEVPDDVMEWAENVFANVDPFPSNPTAPAPYEPIDGNYTKPDVRNLEQ